MLKVKSMFSLQPALYVSSRFRTTKAHSHTPMLCELVRVTAPSIFAMDTQTNGKHTLHPCCAYTVHATLHRGEVNTSRDVRELVSKTKVQSFATQTAFARLYKCVLHSRSEQEGRFATSTACARATIHWTEKQDAKALCMSLDPLNMSSDGFLHGLH